MNINPALNQFKTLQFKIEKLSRSTLLQAELLRDKVFTQIDRKEKASLIASIDKDKFSHVYEENKIKEMQYWVVIDKVNLKVIALTGLYTEKEDNADSCWLGWFCVDEKYREKGFGQKIFIFSIEQARELSKKYLHIYTYNSEKYKVAINMYRQYDFKEYNVKNTKYKQDMYFKKSLRIRDGRCKSKRYS